MESQYPRPSVGHARGRSGLEPAHLPAAISFFIVVVSIDAGLLAAAINTEACRPYRLGVEARHSCLCLPKRARSYSGTTATLSSRETGEEGFRREGGRCA